MKPNTTTRKRSTTPRKPKAEKVAEPKLETLAPAIVEEDLSKLYRGIGLLLVSVPLLLQGHKNAGPTLLEGAMNIIDHIIPDMPKEVLAKVTG